MEVVRRHVRAFSAHDLDGLMACFSADATWTTGTERFYRVTNGRIAAAKIYREGSAEV